MTSTQRTIQKTPAIEMPSIQVARAGRYRKPNPRPVGQNGLSFLEGTVIRAYQCRIQPMFRRLNHSAIRGCSSFIPSYPSYRALD